MKRIFNSPKYRKFLYLLLLAVFALLTWHFAARLVIANHVPFRDPQKRLALILSLVLIWMIKFLFLDQLNPPTPADQTLNKMLLSLRGHFLGAIKFLKKTIIDKHGFSTPLDTLPWY